MNKGYHARDQPKYANPTPSNTAHNKNSLTLKGTKS